MIARGHHDDHGCDGARLRSQLHVAHSDPAGHTSTPTLHISLRVSGPGSIVSSACPPLQSTLHAQRSRGRRRRGGCHDYVELWAVRARSFSVRRRPSRC